MRESSPLHGSSSDSLEATVAEIGPKVRILQIVHAALMAGVIAFFAFQFVRGPKFSDDGGTVPLIPLALAAGGVVISFVAPMLTRQTGLAQLTANPPISTDALMNVFQTGHIAGIAMLEGAALMSCFALTGELSSVPRWFVAVPAGLLAVMAIRFPRPRSVAEWIASCREELDF